MPYLDEALLDDERHLAACDTRGTVRALATAGAQVREGISLSEEADMGRLTRGERPRSVLVASLGGSALVADVLDMLAEPGSPVPVAVCRNVPLPGWVGPLDLVVAVSSSGRAAGPLAVAAEAARRGAQLLTVGAADSPLADVCRRARGVHVDVARNPVSSRTSLWSLLTPVLVGADALGLIDVDAACLRAAADRLDAEAEVCRPSSEAFVNPAKLLALSLSGTVPVVLGDNALNGVAAARAAAMLARTARVPATHGELPDAASQIVATFDGPFTAGGGQGVDRPADIFADPFLDGPEMPRLSLLMLRDAPQVATNPQEAEHAALTDAVLEMAQDAGVGVATVEAEPGPPVVRLAGQVARVDFAATYLAIGSGLDPGASRHLHTLRDRLR